jgi:hypothetical protein
LFVIHNPEEESADLLEKLYLVFGPISPIPKPVSLVPAANL